MKRSWECSSWRRTTQGKHRTDALLAEAEARIAKIAAEIDDVRHAIEATLAKQTELARAAAAEKARVRAAVEFFTAKK